MVLADWQIEQANIVTPFDRCEKRPGKISWGLTSYGLDARLGYRFKVFNNAHCGVVDPKNFDPKSFIEFDLTPGIHVCTSTDGRDTGLPCDGCRERPDHILIPPNSFVLGESLERFVIPRDCLAVCVGKSTYARCGIVVNVTPLEPEWEGYVTIEISNTTPLPAKVYAGEGICQIIFLRGDEICRTSYADKKGRYQGQTGVTLPFVEGVK